MGTELVAALDALPEGADAVPVIREKLVEFTLRLGCSDVNVLPLTAESWLRIDPLKELEAMVGEERIICVSPPE